jgi:pimeloyl-ACP methyl ester carboxylesterase
VSILQEPAQAGRSAPVCIIMLPPAFAQAQDFRQAGFVAAVRARQLALDLVFADIEARHLTDAAVLAQVAGLVATARASGARVWLGGISLGGYVALNAARSQPAALAGLCLLAPYLGSHILTGEIERAGLEAWARTPAPDEEDDERRIWRFLHGRPSGLAIHLGLGREDRFAPRHRILAAALPQAAVDTVAGGHDWPTWHRLWENFLDARIGPT